MLFTLQPVKPSACTRRANFTPHVARSPSSAPPGTPSASAPTPTFASGSYVRCAASAAAPSSASSALQPLQHCRGRLVPGLTAARWGPSTGSPAAAMMATTAAAASGAASGSKEKQYTNRLAQEKSPYLLQHAHNPVGLGGLEGWGGVGWGRDHGSIKRAASFASTQQQQQQQQQQAAAGSSRQQQAAALECSVEEYGTRACVCHSGRPWSRAP